MRLDSARKSRAGTRLSADRQFEGARKRDYDFFNLLVIDVGLGAGYRASPSTPSESRDEAALRQRVAVDIALRHLDRLVTGKQLNVA